MSLPRLLAALALSASTAVHAHSGHAAAHDGHWHATDAWGFVMMGALIAVAIWLSRGGK